MARTKQTPRNPVLERPSPMGSDIQGKRMPSKPTPKKTVKGGKQPCKHILHKTLKQYSATVESRNHIDIILIVSFMRDQEIPANYR